MTISGTLPPKQAQLNHLEASMVTLSSSMNYNTFRARLAVENMTNADTTSNVPGGDPYRRKLVVAEPTTDPKTGAAIIEMQGVTYDPSDFKVEHRPELQAADENGFVKFPNVTRSMELVDAQDASIAKSMAAQMYKLSTSMLRSTIALIDTTKG